MKDPAVFHSDLVRRLERTWAAHLTGEEPAWPHRFPLGVTSKTALESGWQATYQPLIREWHAWAREHPDATVLSEPKRVYTTVQQVPAAVTVPTLHAAAGIAEGDWPRRVEHAAQRMADLDVRFPRTTQRARLLRRVATYTDIDFALLLKVADWFTSNDAHGYTPRQVPIPGVHAKWLNTHQPDILALTGRDTLGLLPRHPARIHFTYLDPTYLASGARTHDSATVGDSFTPAYRPQIVLISENKDTAIHFPPLVNAIAVEGAGYGGGTAAAFDWLTQAPRLYYWGDIDAHGYEILNGFREAGVPVRSILMDLATFEEFEPYGTTTDVTGKPLDTTAKPLPLLTDPERAAYLHITDPHWSGHRRIEQERIPLSRAVTLLDDTSVTHT